MKIWVVERTTGEYSDTSIYFVGLFMELDAAKQAIYNDLAANQNWKAKEFTVYESDSGNVYYNLKFDAFYEDDEYVEEDHGCYSCWQSDVQ